MSWSDWVKEAHRACVVGAATLAIAGCSGDDFAAKDELIEGTCHNRDCTAQCSDNTDNDGDNQIDCQDPDCSEMCANVSSGGSAAAYPPNVAGNVSAIPTDAGVNSTTGGSGGTDPAPSTGGTPAYPLYPDGGSPPVAGDTGGSGGALGATGALYGIPLDAGATGPTGATASTDGPPPDATGAI